MTKKSLSLNEVKQRREKNIPVLFNLEIACSAAKTTTPKVTSRGCSDFSSQIMEMFGKMKTLTVNQVVAGFNACGIEVTSKKVADRLWLLAKQGKLVKGEMKGQYKLAE